MSLSSLSLEIGCACGGEGGRGSLRGMRGGIGRASDLIFFLFQIFFELIICFSVCPR